MSRFNMPSRREKDAENKSVGFKFYKPLPTKAGERHNNNVIIPIFSPAKWKLFNPTVEETQKYGFVGVGGSLIGVPEDLGTPYFQVPCHSVDNFQFASGGVGNAQVVCPHKMNEYLASLYPDARLFDSPKCAFCEKERESWDDHNNRWKELGLDNRSMTPEGRRAFVEQDERLKQTYKKAMKFRAFPKYVLNVFDYDKFTGKRPMDEGQEQLEFQLWFAPRAVFDSLRNLILQDEPVEFWAESNPIPIVTIIKNTEKCRPNDMMQTKYSAQFVGNRVEMDPAWVQYLCNVEAMPDPSDYLQILTYEDQLFYLTEDSGGNSYQPPVQPQSPAQPQAPAQPQQASPPVQPMPPVQSPPQAPPAAPGAPQTAAPQPPQFAPPVQSPTPAAPTTPQPPQFAPPTQSPVPHENPPAPPTPPVPEMPPAPQPPQFAPPTQSPTPPTPDRTPPEAPKSGNFKW